ncbi:calcium:proton antiporter [Corynebacterium sp. YIM 101645]|uniref:Calcium:proton antiporter n=1 Tax=Corynebacterium lemuris TaxID=1859292 RepID=A0ABT2FUK0_9CORY|nr:calcium:proton antiporter [Corynebacterium lemuris]MCS5478614.1 calcium:proton antiporter [Corynebacterium lemuris]
MSLPVAPATTVRSYFSPSVVLRLLVGWLGFLLFSLLGPLLSADSSSPVIWSVLVAVIAVIVVCAFGVMEQAEALAHRLGDPYGTLVLTLSVVGIEVILISAVMLGPGEHTTIGRDSIMAVSMIILNLVLGLALLIGGLRHGSLAHNRTGTSQYLVLIVLLASLAFVVPGFMGTGGSFTTGQAVPVILLTVVLYIFFLHRQMGVQKTDFQEVNLAGTPAQKVPVAAVIAEHRVEVSTHFGLLLALVAPIVLLSHNMATLLDTALDRAGAPVALSGIIIATIVFLPETITTLRAALTGEIQRVSNLTHGALVSTVGMSIPAVLIISLLTGQTVIFAESPVNLVMLAVTMLMSLATFAGPRVTAVHGAAHLVLFVVYLMSVFA